MSLSDYQRAQVEADLRAMEGAESWALLGGEKAITLDEAKNTIARLEGQLRGNILIAYADDYLGAAAVYFDYDAVAYHGLRTRLKGKGLRVTDWELRVKAVARKRKAELEAADKAAKTTTTGVAASKLATIIKEVQPSDQPVVIADLLDAIVRLLKRFLILPPLAAETIALWIMHSYTLEATDITPRLEIKSPLMRSGKTTLLAVLARLAQRALLSSNLSGAVVYRTIDRHRPCMLFDELDTIVNKARGSDERSEQLRGILNAGHSRDTAWVLRTVGDHRQPEAFSTFAAIAYAGIGDYAPGTWGDRAIVIEMKRRKKTEIVERFTRRAKAITGPLFDELASKAARWATDHLANLKDAEPVLPQELDDRASENWEALFAIADLAGMRWSMLARDAALTLSAARADDSSAGVMLLRDIREFFSERGVDRATSAQICEYLINKDERPWARWGHSGITTVQLARLLAIFHVSSITMRTPTERAKGYKLADLRDVFERNLVPDRFWNVTT